MSFPQYPVYRSSDVEWLGDIPRHWEILPLLAAANELMERNTQLDNSHLLSLSYGRIVEKDMASNDGLLPETFETYQVIRGGDIVLRLTDLQNDKRSLRTARSLLSGIITSAYLALRPTNIQSGYFGYLLHAYDATKVYYSMGGGLRQTMKFSDIRHLPVLVPAPSEQATIEVFLDRETAKIDVLVTEQERLIGLLKEKRQAAISQAVTKGLNSSVPMRNGGAEWLGDVPAHWAVCCLRYHASVENGSTPSRDNPAFWEEGTIPWVSSGEVNQYVITDPSDFITPAALEQSSLRVIPKSAVLIGLIGQGKTRGMSAILGTPAAINQNVAAVVTKPTLLPEYLHYSLQAAYDFLRECGRGGNQAALNCEILSAFQIAVPPPEEQAEIVGHLDALHGSITALMKECHRTIALLTERRSALISAAVTGKIDVRGLAPPVQEAA